MKKNLPKDISEIKTDKEPDSKKKKDDKKDKKKDKKKKDKKKKDKKSKDPNAMNPNNEQLQEKIEETVKIIADKSAESQPEAVEIITVINTAAHELEVESDVTFYIAVQALLKGEVLSQWPKYSSVF